MVLKLLFEYSYDMDYIYQNIEEYSQNKKHKILTLFMI